MKAVTGLDRYTIRARLVPALVVALPIPLATIAWFPDGAHIWGVVWGVVTWAGGAAVLAQVARDRGRRKEPALFARWGGKPTVRRLRHRDADNATVLARRHAKLKAIIKVKLPTAAQEAADPAAADAAYEACGVFLRDRTRDQKKFPLIFEENINYGLRGNLWGMKPVAIVVTVLSMVTIAVLAVYDPPTRSGSRAGVVMLAGLIDVLLLLGWIFIFTPDWVRGPADAYSERLLEACERLS